MKPLICDLPYPSSEKVGVDVASGHIISFGYATLDGELNSTLQYVYHSLQLRQTYPQAADTLLTVALAEMHHLHLLGEWMLKLGIKPKYVQRPNSTNYYNTVGVSQATAPQKILMDDIQGEMNAIAQYRKMLFVLKNQDVAALVQRIVLDEELHLDTLKELFEKVK